ncbi:prefoldin subunit 1 [Galendromus occidentalis]|uniref:Prefoldin subunit 1 n=1 Tax=Galendromus occidentalis TaxID=34638 RepID=A0AAJ6VYH8_9ACAR|nr:prefoldin subunit 1 [Galendromus occidentalis]
MASPTQPDMELKKAVKELKQKMIESRRKMNIAEMQVNQHKVLVQKNALIKNVISSYPDESRMFESVGRMFMLSNKKDSLTRLDERSKLAREKIETLEGNQKYLEKSLKDSENNLREMIASKKAAV